MDENECDSSRIRFFGMLLKLPYGGMLYNNGLLVDLSCMVYGDTKKNLMKEQDINKDHLLPVKMMS